jgi:hypothetical protein
MLEALALLLPLALISPRSTMSFQDTLLVHSRREGFFKKKKKERKKKKRREKVSAYLLLIFFTTAWNDKSLSA